MTHALAGILAVLMFVPAHHASVVQDAQARDAAYWRAIVASDFAVPSGQSAAALARELTTLFGHPDPVLRDELGATILNRWIAGGTLDAAALRPLVEEWRQQLAAVPESGDPVLRRSYAALALSDALTRDAAAPFLSGPERARIAETTYQFLATVHDGRGFDDRIGWVHSAAHSADVLRALGRGPYADAAGQARILDGIATAARSSAVWAAGEDERMARAAAVLLIRDDFDAAAFGNWIDRMAAPAPTPLTHAALAGAQNAKNVLAKLGVLLARQPTLPAPALEIRTRVLAAVKF
jgi:hypothetical protein